MPNPRSIEVLAFSRLARSPEVVLVRFYFGADCVDLKLVASEVNSGARTLDLHRNPVQIPKAK
jgi:hypothetical protein